MNVCGISDSMNWWTHGASQAARTHGHGRRMTALNSSPSMIIQVAANAGISAASMPSGPASGMSSQLVETAMPFA